MFQLLKNPSFDFMKRGPMLLGISMVLMVISIGVLAVNGLQLGIEFSGGTELQLKYAEKPNLAEIRNTLIGADIRNPVVTEMGQPEDNEIYIRLATDSLPEGAEDPTTFVTSKLKADSVEGGKVDINVADTERLTGILVQAPGVDSGSAPELAAKIAQARKEGRIFASVGDLATLEGLSAEATAFLESQAYAGPLALRSQSFIHPAIGKELINKALLAILGSLIGMLLYIWIRFQLQWGFAAVVALAHDTLLTLAIFSIFGKELSLPVVAAFLTLVGYSVNDTVVVFDRIRENLKNRTSPTFEDTINLSLNQTLSRTIITSGLTFVVVFGLFLFGGAALNPFSFVLSVGVIVGTYSSIYIASPLVLILKRYKAGRTEAAPVQASAPSAEPRRAKKVRRTSTGGA